MILFILLLPLVEILLYIFLFHCNCLSNFNFLAYAIYKEYWNEYLALFFPILLLYKRNKILNILLITLFLCVFTVDVIQVISYYYTDSFVTIDAFQNFDQILLFLNIKLVGILILICSLFIISVIMIHKTNYSHRFKYLLAILFFTIINFSFYEIEREQYQRTLYDTCRIEKGPIIVFVKTIKYYFNSKKNILVEKLSNDDCNVGRKLNLLDDKCKIKKNQKFYDTKQKLSNIKKPNVIVVFVESLSSKYIGYYNKNLAYTTPNMDNFAKKSLVVKNYINSSFPTLYGLYSQLCSTYPFGIDDSDIDSFLKSFKYKLSNQCLPIYFNQYGYDSIYVNQGGENRKNMKEIVQYLGFKKLFFNTQIKLNLKEDAAHKINFDYTDKQMMKFLVKFLKERHSKDKPFFLSISTIGTHVGLEPVDNNKNIKNLNLTQAQYKTLDNAMKLFFDYFFQSKYKKNTIVIFTGDHVRPSYSKKYNSTTFDDLALMIYAPWIKHSELIANTSSIVLAPTILQMVNYPNKSNTFLGKSLFENNSSIAIGVNSSDNICYDFEKQDRCENISKENLNKITKYIFLGNKDNIQ